MPPAPPAATPDPATAEEREPGGSRVARTVSLSVLAGLIGFFGVTFYRVVAPFLLPLFLAAVVAVLCRPPFMRLRRRMRKRTRTAAGLVTAAVMLLILLPLAAGVLAAGAQVVGLADDARRTVRLYERADDGPADYRDLLAADIRERLDMEPPSPPPALTGENDAEPVADGPADWVDSAVALLPERFGDLEAAVVRGGRGAAGVGVAAGVLGNAAELLIALAMFAVGLYYFLCDGPKLMRAARELVPVQTEYQQALLDRFDTVLRAVVLSTFLAATAQGLLTAIALQLCGLGHFFLFAAAATLASLIPLAGTWLVWGPCAVWLFAQGHVWSAGLLTAFGVGVVGTLDNVIRTVVLNNDAKLHPLLAFVCVLGGLKVMGLWGVFVGPVVAACLHTLLEIFNGELRAFAREKFDPHDPPPRPATAPRRITAKPAPAAAASPA